LTSSTLPPPEAKQTTLQLLRLYGRLAPLLLMTATFSRTMLEEAAGLLGAQVEIVPAEEVAQIETRWGTLLSGAAVLLAGDGFEREGRTGDFLSRPPRSSRRRGQTQN